MAFFQESGDHSVLSPGGKEEAEPAELLFTRGADATLRLVLVQPTPDIDATGALLPSEVGTKAAPPFRLDARRRAVLLVDTLIAPIILLDG